MLKKFTLTAYLILSCLFFTKAQVVAWDFNGITTAVTTQNSTTTNANMNTAVLSRGTGVTATALGNAFAASGWNETSLANAITGNDFFQFTLQAVTNYKFSLSTLDAAFRRSGTGPNQFQWRYSTDNGATFIDLGASISYTGTTSNGDAQSQISLSGIAALQNVGNPNSVIFRLYGWGASGAAGTFALGRITGDDLVLGGTVATLVTNPTITFGTIAPFQQCVGVEAIEGTTVSGTDLNGTNVVIGPLADYSFSTSLNGTYSPVLSLPYTGSTLPSTTIFVKYLPTSAVNTTHQIPANGGNASSNLSVLATAFALPNVVANSSVPAACTGSSITLFGSGAQGYVWNNSVNDNIAFVPTNAATYTVIGTDANGCSATSSIFIPVSAPVNVTANASNLTVCAGNPVTLFGSSATATSYSWNNSVINNTPFSPTSTNTYIVTGSDANNCTGSSVITITVNQLPNVLANATNNPICNGSATTLYGSGANSYSWDNSVVNNTSFIPTSTQTYIVTGTDGNSCSASASITITVNDIPTLNISASTLTPCIGTIVTLNATGNASNYLWDNGIQNNTPFISNTSTTYQVTASNANCSQTQTITINPNTLSSNIALANGGNTTTIGGTAGTFTTNQLANSLQNYVEMGCSAIGRIQSTAALGLTTMNVFTESSILLHNNQPFVARWFEITPTNNLPAQISLYFTQNDFDQYNTYASANGWPLLPVGPSDAAGIARIRLTKNSNSGLGNNPIVLTPTAVNWMTGDNYWEVVCYTPGFSQFRLHAANPGNAALPVSLTTFTVDMASHMDICKWTTAAEQNNASFNISTSTDGIHFEKIAQIASLATQGNSSLPLHYTYRNDKINAGTTYYQLSFVDRDGKEQINQQIVQVTRTENNGILSYYPNPVQDVLHVQYYQVKPTVLQFIITDVRGKVVAEKVVTTQSGLQNIDIPTYHFSSGIYFLQVRQQQQNIFTQKIIK